MDDDSLAAILVHCHIVKAGVRVQRRLMRANPQHCYHRTLHISVGSRIYPR